MLWSPTAAVGPLCALVTLAASPAAAHPHAWIDMHSEVMLDDHGGMTGLRLYWVFDEWYTGYIASDIARSETLSNEFLTSLAAQNLANLAEYDYFTKVLVDGEKVPLGKVTTFDTGLMSERLWLRFEVPLAETVDPRKRKVTYEVYDPTYYIEILHVEDNPVTFVGQGADQCSAKVIDADPTFEAVALASALDVTQTGGDNLGELFAQTVEVSCR
jgi:ABC-type uncharacterized transport system substrate-binding protein